MSSNVNVLKGSFWSLLGSGSNILIVLVTNVILTRLLTPADFGRAGIVMFFVFLSNVLVEAGMAGALIRLVKVSEIDYSTVFIFNLIVSILFYLLIVLSSGLISEFFHDADLKNVIIVTSSVIVLNSFQIVYKVNLIRNFQFFKITIYLIFSVVSASILGIVLAEKGYGIWAIVSIPVCTSIVSLIIYLFFEKASFKKFVFSKDSFLGFFSFGVNTSIASLIIIVFDNIYNLVLAKFFNLTQVGYFYQGKRLLDAQTGVVSNTLSGAVYSYLSKKQDDSNSFLSNFILILEALSIFLGLFMVLAMVFSELIVHLFFGDGWQRSSFYLEMLAFPTFLIALDVLFVLIMKIFNRTKTFLLIEFVKRSFQIVTVFLGVYFLNLKLLIWGLILTSLLSFILNFYNATKIITSSPFVLLKIVIKLLTICLICVFFFKYFINYNNVSIYEKVIFIPVVVLFYCVLVFFFKFTIVEMSIKLIKQRLIWRN